MDPLSHFTETRPAGTNTRVLDSPWCRIVATGHPETIVSFSAILCPPGKFFTSRIFAGVPQNVVFLNCPGNSWYLDGIPGLGGSIADAAEGLLTVLQQLGLGGSRKTFWGGSMGGFGAVVYGAHCNAETIVATGAELELLVAGGNSELILKHRQGRTSYPEIPIESLVANSKGRYFLYAGEFAPHDLVSAKRVMACPNVSVTTLRDFGHPLPGYIEETYGLIRFLADHLSTTTPFTFKRGEKGLLVSHSDWWEDLHAVSTGTGGDEARLVAGLAGKPNIPVDLAAHCGHALSMAASLRGDHAAAVRYADDSLRIDPTSRFLAWRRVRAMKDAGLPPSAWLDAALKIEDLADSNRLEFGDALIEMIGKGLVESGDLKRARKFIATQSKLSARNPKRLEVLAGIFPDPLADAAWRFEFTPECKVSYTRLLLDRADAPAGSKHLLVTGVMLAMNPADRITEVVLNGAGSINSCSMEHDSPGLAKLHPELPHASRSRFKVEIQLNGKSGGSLVLSGKTPSGKTIDWLVLRRSTPVV